MAQLDACPTGDHGVAGSILLGWQYSFLEIDHEILSTVILSLPLIEEWQLSVSGNRMCTILVNCLEDWACPVKVWLGKWTALGMTPLGCKTSAQTNKNMLCMSWWELSSQKHTYIILTPLNPTFIIIVKLGFTGVYIILSYFCSKQRLRVLVRTASARWF